MNPRVKKVKPEADYRLRLTFTDNSVRVFDVKPLLKKGVFRELKGKKDFNSVRAAFGSVQWSGGQDICPDTLYEASLPAACALAVREKTAKYRVKGQGARGKGPVAGDR